MKSELYEDGWTTPQVQRESRCIGHVVERVGNENERNNEKWVSGNLVSDYS